GLPAAGPLRTRSEGAGHLSAGRPDGRPRRRPSRVRPTRVPRRGVAEDTSHHDGGMMDFQNLDAYWRAANYLTVGQIYLQDNPLLREPLRAEHIKPRLLGHWGTSPGLSFIYLHLNRLIRETDADVIYLAGPGHGGPAVLANVHLNGYKIAGPTVLGRSSDDEVASLLRGHGYEPRFVEGHEPMDMHARFAATLETCYAETRAIQQEARRDGRPARRPRWPAIVLRTPKGWTGPKIVDGQPVEGTFRAHQVPLPNVRENAEHLRLLEAWMKSYRPEELFDNEGRLVPALAALVPKGDRRMGILSEQNGQGGLEGYLLTGRHGLFGTYEALAMVSAPMTVQQAKWLQEGIKLAWGDPIASLNILLTSTTWRNDTTASATRG